MYHWVESYRKRIILFFFFFFTPFVPVQALILKDSSYFPDPQRMRMEGTSPSPSLGAGTAWAAGRDAQVRGFA